MALASTNTTCDVYRVGRTPPAPPDVAGVRCLLNPKGQSTLTSGWYTHVMLVPTTTDVRDDFQQAGGAPAAGPNSDFVYVPDKNGQKYQVVEVRRQGRGTALDCKQVLLYRLTVTWPQDNL
jgi:hypothetical protein